MKLTGDSFKKTALSPVLRAISLVRFALRTFGESFSSGLVVSSFLLN